MPRNDRPIAALSPEEQERRRKYDREKQADLRARKRAAGDGFKPKSGRARQSGPREPKPSDTVRVCIECWTTGNANFRGDLTDTYDRDDCPACNGAGTILGSESR